MPKTGVALGHDPLNRVPVDHTDLPVRDLGPCTIRRELTEALQQEGPIRRHDLAEPDDRHDRTQEDDSGPAGHPAEIGSRQLTSDDRDHETYERSNDQGASKRHEDSEHRDPQYAIHPAVQRRFASTKPRASRLNTGANVVALVMSCPE